MKKSLSAFALSVFVLTFVAPFNAMAIHTVDIVGCDVKSDLNIIDKGLLIDITSNDRIQLFKAGARIAQVANVAQGDVVIINKNTLATRSTSVGSVTLSIKPHIDTICGFVGGKKVLKTEPATTIVAQCIINAKDDFNSDGVKDGLNIQFLSFQRGGGAEVVGLERGSNISNLSGSAGAFIIQKNAAGDTVISPTDLTGDERETIKHKAAEICVKNGSSSPIPPSPPSGGAPGGSAPAGPSSGAGADTAVGAGARLEQCTLVKDINLKDDVKVSQGVTIKPGTGEVVTTASGALETKEWAILCLINTVNIITDWIFIVLLVIAVALIAFAGVLWMTAGGDAEKQKKAGQMILAAVIGIIIAILARVIPGIVTGIIL